MESICCRAYILLSRFAPGYETFHHHKKLPCVRVEKNLVMTEICIALVRVMGFIVYVHVRRYRIQAVPVVTMNNSAGRWEVLTYNSFIRGCSKSENVNHSFLGSRQLSPHRFYRCPLVWNFQRYTGRFSTQSFVSTPHLLCYMDVINNRCN